MTFSIRFPSMLKRMIEQKVFRELYTGLFGLGIIINGDFLKYES